MQLRDLLPFAPPRQLGRVNLGVLRQFEALNETLALAEQFVVAARQSNRWGVPRLVFVHSEYREPELAFGNTPEAVQAARKHPELAAAWASLADSIDELFTLAAADVQTRRLARALPMLPERLLSLAAVHPRCAYFHELLQVVDDEVIAVIHPASRQTWRVFVRGIADLGQFHVLLANQVPGPKTGRDPATIRWQFQSPTREMIEGFEGHANWLWEWQPLRNVPLVKGVRTLIAGPPVYARQWVAHQRFPAVTAELKILDQKTITAMRRAA